jgi:hypothetical protein
MSKHVVMLLSAVFTFFVGVREVAGQETRRPDPRAEQIRKLEREVQDLRALLREEQARVSRAQRSVPHPRFSARGAFDNHSKFLAGGPSRGREEARSPRASRFGSARQFPPCFSTQSPRFGWQSSRPGERLGKAAARFGPGHRHGRRHFRRGHAVRHHRAGSFHHPHRFGPSSTAARSWYFQKGSQRFNTADEGGRGGWRMPFNTRKPPARPE